MDGACSTHGGKETYREREVWRGNRKEEIALEDLGVNGWIAVKLNLKKLDWGARTSLI
jgi:hypothetical protein